VPVEIAIFLATARLQEGLQAAQGDEAVDAVLDGAGQHDQREAQQLEVRQRRERDRRRQLVPARHVHLRAWSRPERNHVIPETCEGLRLASRVNVAVQMAAVS